MNSHADQQLRSLSEISTLLARSERVEETLPAILALMKRTLPVRGATLISNRSGRLLAAEWKTEDTSPTRSRLDEVHAQSVFGYFTGARAPSEDRDARAIYEARSASSSKQLRAGLATHDVGDFVVLPLVVRGGPIFGALQVEGDVRLESDLLFVNAIVQQLATALDRQAVLASKEEVVKASRLHAAQRIADLQRILHVQHFFSDLSSLLADSLDQRRVLAGVVGAAVPFLADLCFADELGETGALVRVAASAAGDAQVLGATRPARREQERAGAVAGETPPGCRELQEEVLATRSSIAVPEPGAAGGARDRSCIERMLEAGFASIMVVPLIARGEALGTLTFALRGAKRRYQASDLELAEEVARRTAVAVDHARLHRQTERAVQARENILHIVSHDLRSPLNTLIVSTALLSEDLPPQRATPTGAKALEMIQRSVKRMERMVGDLLDTASIDASRLAIVKGEHALRALVEEAIEAARPAASRRSLRLEARMPEPQIKLACDRERILQVLSNLIGNAIKFTPHGGSIIVSVELLASEIRVAVSDTGAGIERAQLPLVFDRHFQAKQATSIGTGLGLYISKGIIQSHGGSLWVDSEIDKGSTFFFTLPRT